MIYFVAFLNPLTVEDELTRSNYTVLVCNSNTGLIQEKLKKNTTVFSKEEKICYKMIY